MQFQKLTLNTKMFSNMETEKKYLYLLSWFTRQNISKAMENIIHSFFIKRKQIGHRVTNSQVIFHWLLVNRLKSVLLKKSEWAHTSKFHIIWMYKGFYKRMTKALYIEVSEYWLVIICSCARGVYGFIWYIY